MALAISLTPEVLFYVGDLGVTNTYLVTVFIVLSVIVTVAVINRKKFKMIPRGLQNALEAIMELWLSTIDGVTGDRKQSISFFPLVTSLFLFVWLSNLVELIPGLGTIGIYGLHNGEVALIPFLRSGSADLNFTLGIAIVAVVSTWLYGVRELGLFGFLGKFFTLKSPIFTFVGLLELISEFAKMISFSFRLFGNIFAGEVLLMVIAFLAPVIAGLPFLFLELFVGAVQALVFAMLTLVFLKIACEGHSDHPQTQQAH